jgi:hypothetical protein
MAETKAYVSGQWMNH